MTAVNSSSTLRLCLAHGEWKLRMPSCRRECDRVLNTSSAARAPPALAHAGLRPPAVAQACRECRCRSCPACRCVDELGNNLSPQVCHREEQMRRDVPLGELGSAFDCRRACDDFTLDQPPAPPSRFQRAQLGAECTAWTFADGHCIGHTDLGLASSFEAPNAGPAASPAFAFPEASRERFEVGVAACAPASVAAGGAASKAAPLRFAMVHTVASAAIATRGVHPNEGLLQRFRRAAKQFRATTHSYHVVQVSRACSDERWLTTYCKWRPQGIRNEDVSAGYWLRAAVGMKSVSLVNEAAVSKYFPGLLARAFAMRWSDTRLPFWLANLCDLPGLVWFQMHHKRLRWKGITRVWVVQHDIGWTAQLPAILSRFGDEADLLCEGLGPVDRTWNHAEEHNYAIAPDRKWGCVLPVTRYSVRLLEDQSRALAAGNVSYCEMRAATACWNAGWPCRAADIRGRGLLGPFTFYTSVQETRLNMSMCAPARARPGAEVTPEDERCHGSASAAAGAASSVGRLYHRTFEPGLQRSRLADCPMICPSDWEGWKEIAEARQTGCVYNCGPVKTPANKSAPGH